MKHTPAETCKQNTDFVNIQSDHVNKLDGSMLEASRKSPNFEYDKSQYIEVKTGVVMKKVEDLKKLEEAVRDLAAALSYICGGFDSLNDRMYEGEKTLTKHAETINKLGSE